MSDGGDISTKTASWILTALIGVTVVGTMVLLSTVGRPRVPAGTLDVLSSFYANGLGSVGNFIMTNMSLECAVRIDDPSSPTTGVVYMYAGKFRGEMTTTDAHGHTSHGSLIEDTHYLYIWTDDSATTGVRQLIAPDWNVFVVATQKYNAGTPINYSCKPWKRDPSVFIPPENREFVDFSAATSTKFMGNPEAK